MENNYSISKLAESIAIVNHYGQTSKDGKPYIYHLYEVAENVKKYIDVESGFDEADDYETVYKPVALLHDILEDTKFSEEELYDKFGYNIYCLVKELTRGENESYSDFIKRVHSNPVAKKVKLADLESNMNIARIAKCEDYNITDKDLHRIEKYFKAYQYLKFYKGEPIN